MSDTTTAGTTTRQSLFPALRYRDGHAALDFLERAFGFERQAVFDGPGGTIAHAELRLGSACIGVNTATPPVADNPWTSVRCGIYAVLPDGDAVNTLAGQAAAAGARIAQPLRDTDYGSRECSIWDLGGHLWSFGTYTWAPAGDASLFVNLQYPEAAAAVEWLVRVFGFTKGLIVPGDGATVVHAELHLHGSVLMPESASSSPVWAGQTQATCIRVDDVDAHHARAVAAGAAIVAPLSDTSYGARGYTATDLDGFVWTFSTYRPAPLV